MARRRPRQRNSSTLGWSGLGGVLLLLLAIGSGGALAYFYFSAPERPVLDPQTLCPVDGPRSVTVVLLDSTDDIPEIAKREIRTALIDMAETLPAYELLEIRLLDPKFAGGRLIFSKCNPGDGSDLSEYTANPRLARQRWMDGFRAPLDQALETGFSPAPSKISPIMETIQRIAVERFTGRNVEAVPKSLVIISDMLQHGPDYSQYTGNLSYDRFKASIAHKKVQTDLHGTEVLIYYIQRQTGRPINSVDHIRFWAEWIRENNGRFKEATKLQGMG